MPAAIANLPTPSSEFPKTKIWIWASGAFPRRLVYYFRAKGITTTTLEHHNIHLIPCELNMSAGLQSLRGYEARPTDRSLPTLRIRYENGEDFWINETISILEYFEEFFPSSAGYPDLKGNTIEQRSRTRDILNLVSDSFIWYVVKLVHTNVSITSWSGLTAEQMSSTAAEHAGKKNHWLFSRFEKWVEKDIVDKHTASLSGIGVNVTLADIFLMAHVEYAQMTFGIDALAEHGVLRVWFERAKETEWFVTNEDLKKIDQGEGWHTILG